MPTSMIVMEGQVDELARGIRQHLEAIRPAARLVLEHALAAGDLLLRAKELVRHGEWGDWLHTHCDVSERTAQNYMRLARNRSAIEAKSAVTADLTIDDAVRALAKPHIPIEQTAVASLVDHLPIDGQTRVGILNGYGGGMEIFGVVESTVYSGYFHVGHYEFFAGGDEAGGIHSCMKRPIAGEGVRQIIECYIRDPRRLDEIEWTDHASGQWWHLTGLKEAA